MAAARALRYGWLLGFKDPETMPLDELKEAISARGMTTTGDGPDPARLPAARRRPRPKTSGRSAARRRRP